MRFSSEFRRKNQGADCEASEVSEEMRKFTCPKEDCDFLDSITCYVKEKLRDVREPCHVMIDSAAAKTRKSTFLPEKARRTLSRLCERYVELFAENAGILSVRILVSPKNCGGRTKFSAGIRAKISWLR